MQDEAPWWRDRVVGLAVVLGVVVRALAVASLEDPTACTRDECIFRDAAAPLLQGQGLGLAPAGWLPAPGYPYVLAACFLLFGSMEAVRWVQVALAPLMIGALASLAHSAGGRPAARLTAVALALHPTLIFFTTTLWTETVYATLLAVAAWAVVRARSAGVLGAVFAGVVLGGATLTRGVATWLLPLYLIALLVAGERPAPRARRIRHAAAMVLGWALAIAPYSTAMSVAHQRVIVSDATVGHVAWLGNDRFEPIGFDLGNGPATTRVYLRRVGGTRPDCPYDRGPFAMDACLTQRAVGGIVQHPGRFVARIPQRMAQLFNPHTFLTRHLRWRYAPAVPWAVEELLVALQFAFSLVVCVGGAVAMWARARGATAWVTAAPIAYHVAIVAGLYGISRFRVPLEPLALVWIGVALADPRATAHALVAQPVRLVGAVITAALVAAACAGYAWTGWPGWTW